MQESFEVSLRVDWPDDSNGCLYLGGALVGRTRYDSFEEWLSNVVVPWLNWGMEGEVVPAAAVVTKHG